MNESYRPSNQPADSPARICWVNPQEHLLSFHEITGYIQKQFFSSSEEWTFVHNKLSDGYLVQ